jgi:hypothetical protein
LHVHNGNCTTGISPLTNKAGYRAAQGLLHDGMKVLEVTGPRGSADTDPIVTTENLGKL